MSELKYYKLRHIVSALASPDFTTGVVFDNHDEVYYKSEADKVIAELEENHKKEVEQLRMKIAGLEKLVEIADKVLKEKGGFTIKDVTFGGVKLEGINTQRMKHD